VAAMRHAPAMLLPVLILAFLLHPAKALAVDGDGETTFEVPLQANHGLSAVLEADDDEIELKVQKKGQLAVYSAQGEVSADGIAVHFGRLGDFDVAYQPFRTLETREPGRRCEGEPFTVTEGFFRGTMRFHGERDYIRIEATRVKGTLALHPEWRCQYASARASRTHAREAMGDKATLIAYSRSDSTRFAAFGSREKDERPYAYFFAASQEVRERVAIVRFTYARTGSVGFQFDNRHGTAFVDPPAPFAGSARYVRRPDSRDGWSGTLTAPLLGLGRVRLTGPGFHARMVPRLPQFE
jgi:hypothetical protein